MIISELKADNNYIYADFWQGIWRSPLYSACPQDIVHTSANNPYSIYSPGTQFHSASNTITTSRAFMGSNNTNINYSVGNYVEFLEGFEAKINTFIEAKTNGCPD